MTKNERNFMLMAEVRHPVPAKDAFNTDDDIVNVGEYELEKQFRIRVDVLMNFHFPLLVQDTDVHFPGMQIDAAVIPVLVIVESHDLPPSFGK
jgi:hypothetical protein